MSKIKSSIHIEKKYFLIFLIFFSDDALKNKLRIVLENYKGPEKG